MQSLHDDFCFYSAPVIYACGEKAAKLQLAMIP